MEVTQKHECHQIEWGEAFSPLSPNHCLNHALLTKLFNFNSRIVDCHAFQKYQRLHQSYRVFISVMLTPVTISLILISFAYAIVKNVVLALLTNITLIFECIYKKSLMHGNATSTFYDRHIFVRVMCAMFIPLAFGPLCFLCCLGDTIIMHVKHCYRFHRYVGSLEEKSGVLFNDNDDDDDEESMFAHFFQYTLDMAITLKLLGINPN